MARAAHNAGTAFLLCPQEIKNQIYDLVLGDQLFHIWRENPNSKLEHTVLSAEYENNDPGSFKLTSAGRSYRSDHDTKTRLSLALLRVCSQIFSESRYVPWSSNTFVFSISSSNGLVLRRSMRDINLQAVRKLDLEMLYVGHYSSGNKLRDTMDMVVCNMRNLERIRLAIPGPWVGYPVKEKKRPWVGYRVEEKKRLVRVAVDNLKPLVKLPLLKSLMMVMHDKILEDCARAHLALHLAHAESQPSHCNNCSQVHESPQSFDKLENSNLTNSTTDIQPTHDNQAESIPENFNKLTVTDIQPTHDNLAESIPENFNKLTVDSF